MFNSFNIIKIIKINKEKIINNIIIFLDKNLKQVGIKFKDIVDKYPLYYELGFNKENFNIQYYNTIKDPVI